jgi:hypothetical protein
MATDQEVRVRFSALPDFQTSSGYKKQKEKVAALGLEHREYGHRDPSRCPRGTLYLQNLALSSLTSGGSFVCIVHSRTQPTEFSLV